MTLDEARDSLGVARGATEEEIREAFRARARVVHPDRHPHASAAERAHYAREFDRVREARDILARFASDPMRASADTAGPGTSTPPPPAPPRERARPRTSETRRPAAAPRVTMRFDEFVAATDAAGFTIGPRSPRWVDWPRVIAWSTVGVAIAVVVGGGLFAAHVVSAVPGG